MDVYAYNAGFLEVDPDPAGDGDKKHIVVPDGAAVIITPEPGTMPLLGFGLLGVAGARRFRK